MTITLKVYKDSPEYSKYLTARFPRERGYSSGTNETFEYEGHRWKYQVTSFDDNGDYDLLWRPDGKEPELMASDATLRDKFAMAAMQGILSNPAMIDTATDQTIEWVAKNAYQMADAMLKARG